MTKGKKFDSDKLRMDLIPVSALKCFAKVLAHGANKYDDRNWELGIDYNRVYGALLRHVTAWWDNEDIDKDSGLSHLSHALCNMAFLCAYEADKERYFMYDNRPKKGKANAKKRPRIQIQQKNKKRAKSCLSR